MNMSYRTFLLLMVVSPISYAANQTNDFNAELSVTSQMSDNGNKHIDDDLELKKERQDIYRLGSDFQWANEWSEIKGQYSFEHWLYAEDSQPDYDAINGQVRINLGGEYQIPHLEISQSNRSLLTAPDALDVSSNRDQRSITTIEPSLRWGRSDVNKFQASVNASTIKYGKQDFAESTLKGGQLAWMHSISPVDQLSLIGQLDKAAFEFKPSLDYKLETLLVGYSVKLKYLSYGFSVGHNRATESESGEQFSRPNFNINANYEDGFYTIKLNFSGRISNSSAGDGNGESLVGTNLNSMSAGLDLINIKSGGISFETSVICGQCSLGLAVEKNEEEYRTLDESSDLTKAKISFIYTLGRKSSVDIELGKQKRAFSSQVNRDYLRNEYEISYRYNFVKNAQIRLSVRKYFNDSDLSYNKYEENVAGLVISYSL